MYIFLMLSTLCLNYASIFLHCINMFWTNDEHSSLYSIKKRELVVWPHRFSFTSPPMTPLHADFHPVFALPVKKRITSSFLPTFQKKKVLPPNTGSVVPSMRFSHVLHFTPWEKCGCSRVNSKFEEKTVSVSDASTP